MYESFSGLVRNVGLLSLFSVKKILVYHWTV
jgi:hypothetical protein